MTRPLACVLALTLGLLARPGLASAQALYVTSPPAAGAAPTYTGWTNFSFNDDDDGEATIALPFTFSFYGQNYTSVDVSTNGLILFGNTYCGSNGCYSNTTLPASAQPNNLVAFWWDDMQVSSSSGQWTSSGSSPDRVFAIRLTTFGDLSSPYATRTVQIDLHERSGAVIIYYGTIATGTTSETASVGIEDGTGATGLLGLACSPSCTVNDWPANQYVVISPAIDPDLLVLDFGGTALTVVDVNGQPGFRLDVTTTVKNQGQNPATGFTYDLYLSSDATIDPTNDLFLARHTPMETLAGRSQATYTVPGVQFVRPASPGNFYIGAVLDPTNAVTEAVETNNRAAGSPYMVGADLDGAISGPSAGGPGDLVNLNVTVRNRGTDSAGAFDYNVYVSPDRTLDATSDTKLPGFPLRISAIAGGETITQTVQARLPGVPNGAYYFLIEVDPATAARPTGEIAEANESNNSGASTGTITMSASDLVVESIRVHSPVAPHPETTNAFFGEQLHITFSLANTGGAQANDFFVGIYLSENAVITTHDLDMTPIGSAIEHMSFAGGQTQQVEIDVTVPTSLPNNTPLEDGIYYIGVIVDAFGAVAESNETNNLNRAEAEILIRQPAMDVSPVLVEAPAAAAAGERMPIHRVIRNIGNRGSDTVGPVRYRYVLSSNEIISTEDITLGIVGASATVTDGEFLIGVGGEDELTDLVQIPPDVSPGTYFVGLVVDPLKAVRELDETNNTIGSVGVVEIASSSLLVVTSALPDAMVGVPYLQQLVAAGGFGSYSWSLEPGQGTLPEGVTLSESGSLSGRPAHDGVSTFTVRVTSGERTALARLVLRAVPPSGSLGILSSALPSAVKGIAYQVGLVAVGGVRPYQWRLESGALPSGLELDSTGMIGGKLTRSYSETVTFRVSVTDLQGNRALADLSMKAVEAGGLFITTVKLQEAMVGVSYQQQLQPIDSALTWRIRSGALPEGLKLSNGNLLGTPTRVGIYPLRIEVSDANGRSDAADFILPVLPRPAGFEPVEIPEAQIGEAYFLDLSTGATPHAIFALYSGRLPPGLSLSASGRVVGTVSADAAPGSYDFVAQITEDDGQELLVPLTIRVLARPIVVESESTGCSSGGGGLLPWAVALLAFAPLARRRHGCRGTRTAAVAAFACAALALPGVAEARYDVSVTPGASFSPIDGAPAEIASSSAQTTITLPFAFRFWNATHSSVNVGCRGYIAFGSGSATSSVSGGIPATSSAIPLIAPWWGNWSCASNSVTHEVSGIAPQRTVTIQWNDVWYKDDPATSAHGATFQVRLHETTGKIEFAYGPSNHGLYGNPQPPNTTTAKPEDIKAAVGVQQNGTLGASGLPCTSAQSTAGSGARCMPSDYPTNSIITFTQPPDMTMVRVYADEVGFAGVPMRMGASVLNKGGKDAASVVVRFFLSADGVLDADRDAEFGSTRPVDLAVGQRREVVIMPTVPLGLAPGRYYLLAKVDPDGALNEDDENNNVGPSGGLAFDLGDATPDLVPGSMTVPATAAPGATIEVSRELLNIGNAEAGSFDYALYLSANPVISFADTLLSGPTTLAEGIAAFGSTSGTEQASLPADLPVGVYYVGMIVDPTAQFAEISDVNNASTEAARITVVSDTLALLTSTLADGMVQSPYSVQLEAAGGSGAYQYTLASGNLPPGLSLSPSGSISGVPTRESAEPYGFEVMVSSAGKTDLVTLSIRVQAADVPLTVISAEIPAAQFGAPYAVVLSAVGGRPPYRWALAQGEALPPGLTLAPDGRIEGVPALDRASQEQTQAPEFVFQIEVADSAGDSAAQQLSLRVVSPERLQISTSSLPDAYLGVPYVQPLYVAGGRAPFVWSIVEAKLLPSNPMEPADETAQLGIKLVSDKNGARLNGIPACAGTWVLTLKAIDSSGAEDNATFAFSVRYEQGLDIETQALPDAIVGNTYYARLVSNGDEDVKWSIVCIPVLNDQGETVSCRDGLPPGFVLAEDGTFSSGDKAVASPEPEEAGQPAPARTVYSFLVKAQDSKNRSAMRALSVTVRDDEPLYQPTGGGCGCKTAGAGQSVAVLMAAVAAAGLLRRRRS